MHDLSQKTWTKDDSRNWQAALQKYYEIEYVEDLKEFNKTTHLFISRCSQKKSGKEEGTPSEMYWGNINKKFYSMMDRYNLFYGICSDFLGLVFKDDIFKSYDTHPSDITDQDKRKLGEMIATKAKSKGYTTLYFFNTSPLLSRPYFEMLYYSQIPTKYFSNLELVRELFEVEEDLI